MTPKRQRHMTDCGCEPHGGLKCPFHSRTYKPKSLGTFTIDSDEDETSASSSQARAKTGKAKMNSSTAHIAGITRSLGGQALSGPGLATQEYKSSKSYVAPYVEDAEVTPLRDVMPGQKRQRRDFWDQTDNVKSSSTAPVSKELRGADSELLPLHASPIVENGSPSAVIVPVLSPSKIGSGRVIGTPVKDDCTEAPVSADTTRSFTVEAPSVEQTTPTKAKINVTHANHDTTGHPSKLARLVMHAFDINQHVFNNAELRRLLRLYKAATARGDRRDESLQYRAFFLHLWTHVGASRERFDLESLISDICTYQEVAMTDMEVSRRLDEIKMDMANESQDGVKDRAGELWAYVWETYDSDEPSLD